jgi:selT/selW/selH-like putative selenoprotein
VIFSNFLKPVLKFFFNEDHIKIINESKLQIILISYFFLTMILNNVGGTGAFEIFYENQLIFSKLNSGNFPEINQLIKILIQKGAKFKK